MLWHSMPLSIRPAATTDTLKRSIKTIINLLSFACFIIIIVTFNRTFTFTIVLPVFTLETNYP